MKTKFKILHLEDTPADAELVERELKKGNIQFEKLVVVNKKAFEKALVEFAPDIVIADHTLPSFDSFEALRIMKQKGIKIPFILVSATVADEYAVEIMKAGADDYILKDRLHRLPQAILNAMEKNRAESNLETIFENTSEGFILVDTNGIVKAFNTKTAQTISLNIDQEIKIGSSIYDFIQPSRKKNYKDVLSKVLAGETIQYDYAYERKNGDTKWFSFTISPAYTKLGNIEGVCITSADITQRKMAEEQQSLFASIVSSSDDGILSKNIDAIITSWNKGAEKIFGYSAKEIIGKHISVLIPAHLQNEEKLIIEKIKSGISVDHFETTRIKKNGNIIDVSITVSPIKNSVGNIIGASKIVRDISERKVAEEKLNASTELLEQAEELAGLGSFHLKILNSDIITVECSKQQFRLLGFPVRNEVPPIKAIVAHIHPDDRAYVKLAMKEYLEGKTQQLKVFRTNPALLSLRYLLPTLRVFKNKDGDVKSISGTLVDVTERKKAEENLHLLDVQKTAILNTLPANVALINTEGIIIAVNRAWINFGNENGLKSDNSCIGENYITISENATGDEQQMGIEIANGIKAVLNGSEKEFTLEYPCHHPDEQRWFQVKVAPSRKDVITGAVIMHMNITKRIKIEQEVLKLNRLYSFISAINQTIVHAKNEAEVFKRACSIAIELGKFKAAWIGIIDSTSQKINLVEGFGLLPDDLAWFTNVHYNKNGPQHDVVKNNVSYVCNNVNVDLKLTNWKVYAAERVFNSFMVLPIRKSGNIIATFNLYASEIDFFNKVEVDILEEVADDISFALEVFEKEKQRKVYEEKLISVSERLHIATVATNIGIWDWDVINNQLIWDKTMYSIFGVTDDQFSGAYEAWAATVHPEDIDKSNEEVQSALRGDSKFNSVFRIIRKDKTIRYIKGDAIVVRDDKGKPQRMVGTNLDITDLKKAEENLRQSEFRLKEAQAIAHLGNWEVDMINHTESWSDEMYKIYGLLVGEMVPSTGLFLSFIHPDDMDYVLNIFDNSFSNSENLSFNFRFIRKDKEVRYGYAEARFQFDKNKKPIRIFGILKDITPEKLAEVEREKIAGDLIQRNRDLEQFSFIISHNLRAPTANIIGFTEYLNDESLTPSEHKEFMQGLSSSVQKLDLVIKDINTILQVKRDVNEKRETLHFSTLVDDIAVSIGNLIAKHKVRIVQDFSAIDEIYSLRVYLHSIFYNLISNAIKYGKPDEQTVIRIKSKKENGKIILIFKDNGLGIDMNTKGSKVFGLYNRFHTHVEGKGMGLFMVKTQVESLGGKIAVSSKLNKGTEFTIEFNI